MPGPLHLRRFGSAPPGKLRRNARPSAPATPWSPYGPIAAHPHRHPHRGPRRDPHGRGLRAACPDCQTTLGPVTGSAEAGVNVFRGLPFAAPPVGPLRFRPPQPAVPWSAPRAATAFGPECAHVVVGLFSDGQGGTVDGQEDCLYLNVYVPAEPASEPRPVMVWIHGGAFTSGAGSLYDASVFARTHGVVVVTTNYRLGALGFLALADLSAESGGTSGNVGLMDQQAALGWVKANIRAFGGDPARVTIAGESAGGMSVCAHLASPTSAGLFQGAIIQSGLCASPGNTVTEPEAERRNVAWAARVGCRTDVLACLRARDAATLLKTAVPGLRPLANLVWSPVYGTPTLPRPLLDAYRSGQFNRVPVLVGTNHDEGRVFVVLASPRGNPISLPLYWGGAGLLTGAGKVSQVLKAYPGRAPGTPALAFATLFTDAVFSCPAVQVSTALSAHVPVYAFEFNDPQAVTTLKVPPGLTSLGAFHGSSLVYVFQTRLSGLADPAAFTPAQRALANDFGSAWAAFVKTGRPASQAAWPPFDPALGNVEVFMPGGAAQRTDVATDHQCGLWSSLGLK
ncbi:carboxylesterase/lipase family protein [Deinococcus metalli]|uniref:carboxylesterase/lipase family protein n=1 Tax=Deinococcus metalli TaxID=1141878 RepID=UPI0016093771|nr:carboxylesterase family protein [Deinococcus metalli]